MVQLLSLDLIFVFLVFEIRSHIITIPYLTFENRYVLMIMVYVTLSILHLKVFSLLIFSYTSLTFISAWSASYWNMYGSPKRYLG